MLDCSLDVVLLLSFSASIFFSVSIKAILKKLEHTQKSILVSTLFELMCEQVVHP